MIHKGRAFVIFAVIALFSREACAELRSVSVIDKSTSGRLVRLNVGGREGLRLSEPVLFSASSQKIAAGRVIRVDETTSVVAVLEKYGEETPNPDADYELLYGEPFPEAANLPDYVADREDERDNPANEKFWVENKEDTAPELDDDDYTPETKIRPKFPEPRTYSPHNLTVGINSFRNNSLPTSTNGDGTPIYPSGKTTYNGYSFRYAYTFRSHYWLRSQTPALIAAEFGLGIYSFSHTFPSAMRNSAADEVSAIRVFPLHFGLRYLVEVSKLFRIYPYIGYQHNFVGAGTRAPMNGTDVLAGGRIFGGAGAVLVMSNAIDARLEGGTDGLLGGIVVKF